MSDQALWLQLTRMAGSTVDAAEDVLPIIDASGPDTRGITPTQLLRGMGLTATAAELNDYAVTLDIADGSADAVYYVIAPHAGTISQIKTVIDAVVSTADITITPAIGVTAVTDGVITIATAASAAGDIDTATPSAANVVTAGQAINFTVAGGGSGGSPRIHLVATITR